MHRIHSITLPLLGLALSLSVSLPLAAAQSSSGGQLFARADVTGDVSAKFNFTYIEGQGVRVDIYQMTSFRDATLKVYPCAATFSA